MSKKLYDAYGGIENESRKHTPNYREKFFEDLYTPQEGCPCCEFSGPLLLRRRGWTCPKCKELVIANE